MGAAAYGVVKDWRQVERIVGRLHDQGFSALDVSVLMPNMHRANERGAQAAARPNQLGWLVALGALKFPGEPGAALRGALIRLGVLAEDRDRILAQLNAGSAVVAVHCADNQAARRARNVLSADSAQWSEMTAEPLLVP